MTATAAFLRGAATRVAAQFQSQGRSCKSRISRRGKTGRMHSCRLRQCPAKDVQFGIPMLSRYRRAGTESLSGSGHWIRRSVSGLSFPTIVSPLTTSPTPRWVSPTETKTSHVQRQTLCNLSKSCTSQQLSGATWNITYGDGSSSSGDVWLDSVNVGGVVVPH